MMTNETAYQLKQQIELNKDLFRFCSYLINHLAKHEDTERFDNMFISILEKFNSNREPDDCSIWEQP